MNKITKIIEINEELYNIEETPKNEEWLNAVGTTLRQGGVVAFPTETVYGLGANALDKQAAQKIYEAKGRPSDNPLIIHIAKEEDVYKIAQDISDKAYQVMKNFWPGSITLVLNKKENVPVETTGGLDTVAVRFPKHMLACKIIEAGGGFICAPSANISGKPSPTKGVHVMEDMNGKIDTIVSCDNVSIGVESTILDMTVEPPMVLRPGAITKEMLEKVIGKIAVDDGILNQKQPDKPKAPGMKYRHYAPQAEMVVVKAHPLHFSDYICKVVSKEEAIGVICCSEHKDIYHKKLAEIKVPYIIKVLGSEKNSLELTKNLYDTLRGFDQSKVEKIFTESFEGDEITQALMNRLNKAAGYNIVKIDN